MDWSDRSKLPKRVKVAVPALVEMTSSVTFEKKRELLLQTLDGWLNDGVEFPGKQAPIFDRFGKSVPLTNAERDALVLQHRDIQHSLYGEMLRVGMIDNENLGQCLPYVIEKVMSDSVILYRLDDGDEERT